MIVANTGALEVDPLADEDTLQAVINYCKAELEAEPEPAEPTKAG